MARAMNEWQGVILKLAFKNADPMCTVCGLAKATCFTIVKSTNQGVKAFGGRCPGCFGDLLRAEEARKG